jgi:hypothetical protein
MNCKFQTKQDYQEAVRALTEPLKPYYSPGKALVKIGETEAHYGERVARLEGFSRILWGLVPLWKGGGESSLDAFVLEGIRHGTDPGHPEYWGSYGDGSQAYVEMAALAYGILLTPERIWEPLSEEEKCHFENWLLQINTHVIPDNNWLFFRVLVNCALKSVKAAYSQEQIEKDLNRIEEFYLGDGWYSDGPTFQRDYYIGFAMHFYSLIYAKFMGREDPERARTYRERAVLFAKDFLYWFGERGEALPYGRSLTYRFAQGCFWGALAFDDVEALPWGVIKGLVNRQFRWWFQQPILDCEGKLTLGYAYPNLNPCEGYNSPQSPYWALKSLIVLALPQEHPFWTAKEEPLPKLEEIHAEKHAGLLFQRGADGYAVALAAGQFSAWEPMHCAEKYEKFAYSGYFGFQVPRSYRNLAQGAFDNMLAFWKDGFYHVRRTCQEVRMEADRIWCRWSPLQGVEVETELKPEKTGHLRTHVVHADYPVKAAEGGFALPFHEQEELELQEENGQAKVKGTEGESLIHLRMGTAKGHCVFCESNVNLLYPKTVLPMMEYEFPAGTTTVSVYVEGTPKTERP